MTALSGDRLARKCDPGGVAEAELASIESPRCRNDSSRHDRPIFGNRRRLSLPVPPSWALAQTGSGDRMTSETTRGDAAVTSHPSQRTVVMSDSLGVNDREVIS